MIFVIVLIEYHMNDPHMIILLSPVLVGNYFRSIFWNMRNSVQAQLNFSYMVQVYTVVYGNFIKIKALIRM